MVSKFLQVCQSNEGSEETKTASWVLSRRLFVISFPILIFCVIDDTQWHFCSDSDFAPSVSLNVLACRRHKPCCFFHAFSFFAFCRAGLPKPNLWLHVISVWMESPDFPCCAKALTVPICKFFTGAELDANGILVVAWFTYVIVCVRTPFHCTSVASHSDVRPLQR